MFHLYRCSECRWVFEKSKRSYTSDECFGRIYTSSEDVCPECGSTEIDITDFDDDQNDVEPD